MSTGTMITGTIKAFLTERGFGFIRRDDGAEDVFVHSTALPGGAATPGVRVEFDLAENPYNGKQCAVNVSVLD